MNVSGISEHIYGMEFLYHEVFYRVYIIADRYISEEIFILNTRTNAVDNDSEHYFYRIKVLLF